jgi:hypothetical protein
MFKFLAYMRNIFLAICVVSFQVARSQAVIWKTVTVDSNLAIDMPGSVLKEAPRVIDRYTYQVFGSRADSALFFVLVGTSIEKIEINNMKDYLEALTFMAEGALKGAEERQWATKLSNTSYHDVPCKKIEFSGKFGGVETKGFYYCFLVNGFAYIANAVFLKPSLSAKDSANLDQFISSARFTQDIRELRFAKRSEYVGYGAGRLISLFIMIGIIVAVIIVVLRSL